MSRSPGGRAAGVSTSRDGLVGRFTAMASPCEVLVDMDDQAAAAAALEIARAEALRIEHKFSRYREDNIVHRINHAEGRPVAVDEETARLVDYAATCHAISEGAFDITSGALGRLWKFDGSDRAPDPERLARALGSEDPVCGLLELGAATGVPRSLADIGLAGDALETAADLTTAKPYPNPRPASISASHSGTAPCRISRAEPT